MVTSYLLPSSIEGVELGDLLDKVRDYFAEDKLSLIKEAYSYAEEHHRGQMRKSGEPYIQHSLHTALLMADLRLDGAAVAAALLHDVPEDCGVPLEEIEARFGPEVRMLVDGVTKLGKLPWPAGGADAGSRRRVDRAHNRAENLRKMLLAMAEDIRVVLIKLGDRLHNMRTLWALPPPKRREIAQETLDIYAPLSHRLGMWEFKWQLEDHSFRYLHPDKYREIAKLLASQREARENYINQVARILQEELDKAGIKAEVWGRPKHIYSIYQKMEKYQAQGKSFGQIYDLLALRVLVGDVGACYSALGIVHNLWHPLPDQFDDYIGSPKENGYQALHTAVMCIGGQLLEVQIKTYQMHWVAEYGVAAHWRYKEGASKDMHFEEKLTWLRQLLEWQRELARAEDFVEAVKDDIFKDRVFVYTPKGDIKDLSAGSTPLDFAYLIHTDLGNRCIGAKVKGRLVPLNHALQTGDMVEILVGKGSRGPSRDWLNPNLGYTKTTHAKEKIRQWFRRSEREENVTKGRELLERELKRLGLAMEEKELAHLFKYSSVETFLAAIGCGDVSTGSIALKLAAQEEKPLALPSAIPTPSTGPTGVKVLGVGDLLTHIARCCHPVPGDEIIGYITRTRGITVHRGDCHNVLNEDEQDRLIRVEWGPMGRLYAVPVRITAWDRVGLLRDIATIVSAEGINMAQAAHTTQPDGTASIVITLETTGIAQLSRILSRLEGVPGVVSIARSSEGA